jgi:hypothetical protein
MKYLILISILMVGCIVEPRTNENQNTEILGKWHSVMYQTVYVDVVSYKNTATYSGGFMGIAEMHSNGGGELIENIFRCDNDTLKIKMDEYEYKFVRERK